MNDYYMGELRTKSRRYSHWSLIPLEENRNNQTRKLTNKPTKEKDNLRTRVTELVRGKKTYQLLKFLLVSIWRRCAITASLQSESGILASHFGLKGKEKSERKEYIIEKSALIRSHLPSWPWGKYLSRVIQVTVYFILSQIKYPK